MGNARTQRPLRGAGTAALVLAGLLATAGCVSTMSPVNGIPVSHDRQYQDIPVPFKFDFDRDSWAYTQFETGPLAMRSCRLIYWGDRPLSELRLWYRDQMEKHGWRHEETLQDGDVLMTFTKENEEARIQLKRMLQRGGGGQITRVTADIGVRG